LEDTFTLMMPTCVNSSRVRRRNSRNQKNFSATQGQSFATRTKESGSVPVLETKKHNKLDHAPRSTVLVACEWVAWQTTQQFM